MKRSLKNYWLVSAVVTALVGGTAKSGEPMKRDMVLFREVGKYAAFPNIATDAGDNLWVSFGWNTTRSHYGKAAGGKTGGETLYSPDGGLSWFRRGKDTGFKQRPKDLGAFILSDETVLNVWPQMHEVLPTSKKEELVARGVAVKEWPDGHISACYRAKMWKREPDEEQRHQKYISLPAFASMGGFGAGVVLPNDVVLKPVYGKRTVDDPATSAWVLRSADRGDSWELVDMAYDGRHDFNEAELLALPNGRVLAMIRSESGTHEVPLHERGFLWQCHSDDHGKTWSQPRRTDIWGYPPHLLSVAGGNILCTYGYRRRPYGIRACFSRDGGETWDTEREAILRCDALSKGPGSGRGGIGDLGYPKTVELSDGTLLTVYYITLDDGVTHIAATHWSRDYVGPADLARGAAAVPKPDPSLPPEHIIREEGSSPLVYGVMQSFIPTENKIAMVAIRLSKESADPKLTHTYGLSVVIRKPKGNSWWTEWLGESRVLKPDSVKCGAWNAFVFDRPVEVTPGETYALTVYNKDYLGGGETRLKDGLTGDHKWHVNSGPGNVGDYPNGGMAANITEDLAFKVHGTIEELPKD